MYSIFLIWQTLTEALLFACGCVRHQGPRGKCTSRYLCLGGGTKRIQETTPDLTPGYHQQLHILELRNVPRQLVFVSMGVEVIVWLASTLCTSMHTYKHRHKLNISETDKPIL